MNAAIKAGVITLLIVGIGFVLMTFLTDSDPLRATEILPQNLFRQLAAARVSARCAEASSPWHAHDTDSSD